MTDFGKMNRSDRELTAGEVSSLLASSPAGTLAVNGPDGYPYAVPMHYALDGDGRVLFHHSAADGLLLDCVRGSDRACLTVQRTGDDLSSESVIAFGRIREEPSLWDRAIHAYIDRYIPEGHRDGPRRGVPGAEGGATCIVMDIEHMSGKRVSRP